MFKERLKQVVFVVGLLAVVGSCNYGIYRSEKYLKEHPCIKTVTHARTCGGGWRCSFYDTEYVCVMWEVEEEYRCDWEECVERKQ